MKKIMFILLLISSLFGKEDFGIFESYVSKTRVIDFKNSSSEEVFFGKYDKYQEGMKEFVKNNLLNGLSSGASTAANAVSNSAVNASGQALGQALGQGLGLGLGIGVVFAGIGLTYGKLTENDTFILIKDYTDNAGNKSRVSALFIAKSYSNEENIKSFLQDNINSYLN